jgi:hypothetical protein
MAALPRTPIGFASKRASLSSSSMLDLAAVSNCTPGADDAKCTEAALRQPLLGLWNGASNFARWGSPLNYLEPFLGNEAGPLLQFIKYAISGCVAVSTHILVFHVVAWKLFFALQADDWFVRLFDLSIQELDDSTRSRNSMKGNGVAFVISNLVAYLINIYWVFVPGRYYWIVEIGLFYIVSGVAIVIGTALMGFLIRRFGMLTTHAFGANIFSALMINYAMRKFFIFNG